MKDQDYEISGWELNSLSTSANKVLLLARELSVNTTEFCIEAHFRDLDALKRVSEIVPSNRYACYCWRPIAAPSELRDAEFAEIRNVRVVFDHTSISVEESHALPVYDWDGRPGESVTLRLVRQHSKPLSEHSKQPSMATIELCSAIAASVLGSSLPEPVKTVTEWTDEGRAHNYLMTVPKSKAALIASELSSRLALAGGVASFEFLGTANQIEEIQRRGHYSFDRFPANCWSFNQGGGRTPFALERAGFIAPVLNVDDSRLVQAAATLDSLNARVTGCSIVRRYIAWRLEASHVSPRTRGNYLLLSQQRVGCALFVALEQYADRDPTSQQFAASAAGRMEPLGIRLKKVANVR